LENAFQEINNGNLSGGRYKIHVNTLPLNSENGEEDNRILLDVEILEHQTGFEDKKILKMSFLDAPNTDYLYLNAARFNPLFHVREYFAFVDLERIDQKWNIKIEKIYQEQIRQIQDRLIYSATPRSPVITMIDAGRNILNNYYWPNMGLAEYFSRTVHEGSLDTQGYWQVYDELLQENPEKLADILSKRESDYVATHVVGLICNPWEWLFQAKLTGLLDHIKLGEVFDFETLSDLLQWGLKKEVPFDYPDKFAKFDPLTALLVLSNIYKLNIRNYYTSSIGFMQILNFLEQTKRIKPADVAMIIDLVNPVLYARSKIKPIDSYEI
jgi:hypothetical protein